MSRGTRRLGLMVVVIFALVLSGCPLSAKGQIGLAGIGLGVVAIVEGAAIMESAKSAPESEPWVSTFWLRVYEGLGGALLVGGGGLLVCGGLYAVVTDWEWEEEPQPREAPLATRRRQLERRRWKDQTHLFVTPNGAAVTYRF